MNDRYIVVELEDGRVLDFNKTCTNVNYSDKNYCVFKKDVGDACYTLAVIPHDSIYNIMFYDRRLFEVEKGE